MNKNRLEGLSDAIVAIVITVMLIELHIPQGVNFSDLQKELTAIFSYILSFIYVGIYWSNHHHLFQLVQSINGKIMWVNLHLLFWMTMIPFSTNWASQTNYASVPTAIYASVLFMCALSYSILENQIIREQGTESVIRKVLGKDKKLTLSVFLYLVSILFSFLNTYIAITVLVGLAAMWFIPNKNIEKYINEKRNRF